jgi:RHS repeat-associated protein
MNRLTKIKYKGKAVAQYAYDELDRRTLLTLGNNASIAYEYDLADRLTKLTNHVNDVNIIFDYSSYDKVGNRLRCKIDDADAQAYTYDKLYQLTYVDYNDGNSTTYHYDNLGSRKNISNGGTENYSRNRLNQYTSVNGTNFSYDNNGNLTNDGTYRYYYDCENRLTDVNDQNDSPVASYKYDFMGRRVKKDVGGTVTKYCYDGGQVIAEYDGNDTLLRKFTYGPGIDEPIYMSIVGGSRYYYHYDGLGSVVALSSSLGDIGIVEKYEYDVFGEVIIRDANNSVLSESSVANPYMFTGRRLDNETGNYYYRARYYKPEIGRFLQPDPIGCI